MKQTGNLECAYCQFIVSDSFFLVAKFAKEKVAPLVEEMDENHPIDHAVHC